MKKLSVIIPCYNVEKYVERTLMSIISQISEWCEIILVNDGSKDGTLNLLEKYRSMYPQLIRLYTINNSGVSAARNLGIRVAAGKYIYLIDGDDFIEDNILESWILFMEENALDICFSGYKEIEFSSNNIIYSKLNQLSGIKDGKDVLELRLRKKIWLCTGNVIYRASRILENNVEYNQALAYGEDAEFIGTCLFYAERVASWNLFALNIVIRTGSAMNNVCFSKYMDALYANCNIMKLVGSNASLKDAVLYDYICLYLGAVKILFREYSIWTSVLSRKLKTIARPSIIPSEMDKQKWLEWTLASQYPFIYFYIVKIYNLLKHV